MHIDVSVFDRQHFALAQHSQNPRRRFNGIGQ
jgi:hypothetical protein